MRFLSEFVEAEIAHYAKCHQHMSDLQRELACLNLATASGSSTAFGFNSTGAQLAQLAQDLASPSDQQPVAPPAGKKRARILYDYDAHDSTELSLLANEVIIVTQSAGLDSDFVVGERGAQRGKVPLAYLEVLN